MKRILIIITLILLTSCNAKSKPQVINTYDSDLVEMSIDYKDDIYTVDIEKYNKHFTVPYTNTKIIIHYETKAVVEEYNNGTVKIYFYIGVD